MRRLVIATARRLAPWLAFLLMFGLGWRTYHVTSSIPAYGDALEVIWGIEWYYEALFEQHLSPFFTPLVFHPSGWHTASLAHTPLLFTIGAIMLALGSTSALAYNLLCLLSFIIAYAGARRLFCRAVEEFSATLAALVFTFMAMRWMRVEGHLHMLFATSLLPWFVDSLLALLALADETANKPAGSRLWRQIAASGAWWGLMIHLSLYSIFFALPGFAIGGRRWFQRQRMLWAAAITVPALLLAAPLIGLYLQAEGVERPERLNIVYLLLGWSTSLNSLFIPSINHAIPELRQFALSLYSGPHDESGLMNLGAITWLLALIGVFRSLRHRQKGAAGLAWLAGVGLILSMGVLLRWNGVFLSIPSLAPFDRMLWHLGHWLKPHLFDSAEPLLFFEQGIPLPGYLLAILLPVWESARVQARYAFVGGVGLIGLAALGLQSLSKPLRWGLAALWLIESLPSTTADLPLPTEPHPAYTWVAQHPLPPGEGIIDLFADPARMVGGEIVYATRFHRQATVSGVGSFAPRQLHFLQKWFFSDEAAFERPETAALLLGYGVRYALFHLQNPDDWMVWNQLAKNPGLRSVGCFDPLVTISPWPYPICISQVLRPAQWSKINLWLQEGWSGAETWGLWAEGENSKAEWVATQQRDHHLQMQAFPNCVEGMRQRLTLLVNSHLIAEYTWQSCEELQDTILIPQEHVVVGWNRIEFRCAYALPPTPQAGDSGGDRRPLSVGFTQLTID